jgi:hypothetical protein
MAAEGCNPSTFMVPLWGWWLAQIFSHCGIARQQEYTSGVKLSFP